MWKSTVVLVAATLVCALGAQLEDEPSEGGALSDLSAYAQSTTENPPQAETAAQAPSQAVTPSAQAPDEHEKTAQKTEIGRLLSTLPTQQAQQAAPAEAKSAKNSKAVNAASYGRLSNADNDMESVEKGAAQIALDSKQLEVEAFNDIADHKGAKQVTLGDAVQTATEPKLFNALKNDASNLDLYAKEKQALAEVSQVHPIDDEHPLDTQRQQQAIRDTEQMAQNFQRLSSQVQQKSSAGVAREANHLGALAQDVVQAEAKAEGQDQAFETVEEDHLIDIAN